MEYVIGGTFESLTKRILYAYPAAYPQFVPVECSAGVEAQKDMYSFMEQVLIRLYEVPEDFGFPIFPDEYYGPWQLANTNPDLMAKMEKIESRFTAIITTLIKIGQAGELNSGGLFVPKSSRAVSKGTAELLAKLGVNITDDKNGCTLSLTDFPSAFEAWKAYAAEDNEGATKVDRTVTFIYGKYFGRVYTAAQFFTGLLYQRETDGKYNTKNKQNQGNISGRQEKPGTTNVPESLSELMKLEEFLKTSGHTCGNSLLNGKTRYACTKWSKDYPNGQKSYFSVSFNPRVEHQLKIEFHLPSFRPLIEESFDSFDEKLKSFVFTRLNDCSSCGYCTQTDKSGKREKLARVMELNGTKKLKCPLFPNFTFGEFNSDEMQRMKILCEYADKKTLE